MISCSTHNPKLLVEPPNSDRQPLYFRAISDKVKPRVSIAAQRNCSRQVDHYLRVRLPGKGGPKFRDLCANELKGRLTVAAVISEEALYSLEILLPRLNPVAR